MDLLHPPAIQVITAQGPPVDAFQFLQVLTHSNHLMGTHTLLHTSLLLLPLQRPFRPMGVFLEALLPRTSPLCEETPMQLLMQNGGGGHGILPLTLRLEVALTLALLQAV